MNGCVGTRRGDGAETSNYGGGVEGLSVVRPTVSPVGLLLVGKGVLFVLRGLVWCLEGIRPLLIVYK